MLKKGCAIGAAVFLAVFGGYYLLLHGRGLEFPVPLVLALFGSLGLLMLLSQLKAVLIGDPDVEVLERAAQGLPMADGRKEAAWGPIVPLGEPLTAPFSGRPCVAYEYDAKRAARDGASESGASDAAGFALCPSVVRSSRGDVRLLGFSLLNDFPDKDVRNEPGAFERAQAFAATTAFQQMGIAQLGSMLSHLDEAMSDDDGAVRKDWRMKDAHEVDLAACALKEKLVAPGEMVTAVGIWDASRGGLVPNHRDASAIVTLMPGGGEAMVFHKKKRPWGLLLFALVWSGMAHAFIYLAITRAPLR